VVAAKKRVLSLTAMARREREDDEPDDEPESTHVQKSLRLTGEGKSVVSCNNILLPDIFFI
jgi:hypothetical protein